MFNEITVRLFVDTSKIDVKKLLETESHLGGDVRVLEYELGDTFLTRKLALEALENISTDSTYESNINHDFSDDEEDEELVDASDYATMALSHIAWAKRVSEGSNALQLDLFVN